MSHEGRRAFDNRSSAEVKRDKEREFYRKAEEQLHEEGKIPTFCATDDDFRRRDEAIGSLAHELRERAELKRLSDKYDH